MKYVKLPLFLIVTILLAAPAAAQSLVPDVAPYVNQYIATSGEIEPSEAWWDALASELVLAVASPEGGEVSESALQNVIFFAQMHGKRLHLKPAVPHLLELYRSAEQEGTRIMALAALHAIGNRAAMDDLRQGVAYETSPRVKKLTVAALSEYYR